MTSSPPRAPSVLAALALPLSIAACQPGPARAPASEPTPPARTTPAEAPLPAPKETEDPDVVTLRSRKDRASAHERLAKRMTSRDAADDEAATELSRLLDDEDAELRAAVRELLRLRLGAKLAGDYLGRLGAALRADLGPQEDGAPDRQPGKAVFDALAYLELVPKDEATRNELLAWARTNGRLGKAPGGARAPFFPAWHALIAMGALRDDMPVAEAESLLGPPTAKTAKHVEWYAESRMHVNPSLSAEIRGDRLFGFNVAMR